MRQVRFIVQRGKAIPSHEDCGRLHGVGDNSDSSCVSEPQEYHGKLGKQPAHEGRHRNVHQDGGSYSQLADRTRKGRALFEFREDGQCSKQVTVILLLLLPLLLLLLLIIIIIIIIII